MERREAFSPAELQQLERLRLLEGCQSQLWGVFRQLRGCEADWASPQEQQEIFAAYQEQGETMALLDQRLLQFRKQCLEAYGLSVEELGERLDKELSQRRDQVLREARQRHPLEPRRVGAVSSDPPAQWRRRPWLMGLLQPQPGFPAPRVPQPQLYWSLQGSLLRAMAPAAPEAGAAELPGPSAVPRAQPEPRDFGTLPSSSGAPAVHREVPQALPAPWSAPSAPSAPAAAPANNLSSGGEVPGVPTVGAWDYTSPERVALAAKERFADRVVQRQAQAGASVEQQLEARKSYYQRQLAEVKELSELQERQTYAGCSDKKPEYGRRVAEQQHARRGEELFLVQKLRELENSDTSSR